MSGSGGYFRFRCKYFLTHDCKNWVYVNNTACAECSAKGRDVEAAPCQVPAMETLREISVPRVEGGVLYYTLMEVQMVSTNASGQYWAVRHKADNQSQPQIPTTTSALPGTPMAPSFF